MSKELLNDIHGGDDVREQKLATRIARSTRLGFSDTPEELPPHQDMAARIRTSRDAATKLTRG